MRTTIPLKTAKKLAKNHGQWVWDGLLYERDSITNPKLVIIPNKSGLRIKKILKECY